MVLSYLKLILVVSGFSIFISFLRQREHFLLALLSLELVVVMVVGILAIQRVVAVGQLECLMFVMLALGACEARIGLGLLVFIVRVYGRDLMQSMSVHKP